MTTLVIYRPPSTELITINIDDSAILSHKMMAEWNITLTYTSPTILDLQIGDFVVVDSVYFYLTRLPDVEKLNNSTFRYSLVFQSVFSELQTRLNFSTDGLTEYDYTGTADDFLTNIVALVADLGWSKGVVDASLPINISFSNEYCSASLTRIAEAFKFEYEIVGRVINLKKAIGTTTALTFEYGQGKGLYNITRQQVSDQNILTKVFGFGGTRNIPADYRNRAKRLVFETTVGSNRFLTKNVDLYGTIEGQFTDDNIFPQRTGTLTGADINFDVATPYAFDATTSYVEDSTLDFDINSYLLEGQTAKIVFKTGDLAGIECEIIRYDNATKRIYFNANVDANDGYTLPKYLSAISQLKPIIGDTYTLVDIKMPQSYVDTAEAALEAATQTFIDENSVPMVVYSVALDPQYVKTIAAPKVGDKVTVVDTDLGINSLIRISGLEYPLVNPNKITATIADFVPYTLQERIIKQTITNKKETIFVDRKAALLARNNTLRQNQLRELIFDTDNYFDTGNIRPLSIETAFMSVGFKSSDFWLSNVVITTNVGGNANSMNVSAGSLVHLQITIPSVGFTWVIGTPLTATSLTPASAYYLYAKCSKTALTGEWILSASQITVEQTAGYYHFYCGNLFVVADGRRDFDFVKGMTYIVGDTIKSGTIQSIDAQNYFNLTEGKFRIGNATTSLDFNVTTPNVLTLKGALVQTSAGTIPLLTFVGAYDAGVTYEQGNQVTYGGSSWTWINATPASGQTPAEDAYWTKSAAAGANGADGTDGTDGISILAQGSYVDVAALIAAKGALQNGWSYYNTTDKKSYVYYAPTWYLIASDGANGENGTNGISVLFQGSYATVAALITDKGALQQGWAYYNSTDKKSYVYYGTTWYTMASDGANGVSIVYKGSYASAAAMLLANEGSALLNILVDEEGDEIHTEDGDQILMPEPQQGWSYYNTTDNKSYAYFSPSWYIIATGGTTGPAGDNSYLHIAWANSADGSTDFSTSVSTNKLYIGVYSDFIEADSEVYTLYDWTLTKGEQGVSSYLHIAWANSADGATDFSKVTSASRTYIGTVSNSTASDSALVYGDYSWVLLKGADGPSLVYRGLFSPTVAYHYTDVNRDIVKYGDSWYLFKSKLNNNTSGAWGDGSRWEIFGGSFESIATGLLFADRATIDNLYVNELATAASGARITINELGTGQEYKVYDSAESLKVIVKPTPISSIATIEAGAASETDNPTAISTAEQTTVWNYGDPLFVSYTEYSNSFVVSLSAQVLEIEVENITLAASYSSALYATASSVVSVYLQKYVNSAWIRVGRILINGGSPVIIQGMTAGTYRLEAYHTHTAIPDEGEIHEDATVTINSSWAYTTGSSFTVTTRSIIAQTEIGTDGFCSVWASDNYFHFSNAGLKIKGDVNMPGILGSGSSSSGGTLTNVIGKLTGVTKDSTGNYTITHGLGFSTYMAMITPITSNAKLNPVIVSKSTDSFAIKIVDASNDTATDTAFDILIIGNNV